MKLFYSQNSPYARKCRIVIREKGLEGRVEEFSTSPIDNAPELLATNPLGAVPALIAEDGTAFCDSPVICEYLDSLPSNVKPLIPTDTKSRIAALRLAAFGDGLMDASVTIVLENRRPAELRSATWIERKEAAILRTLELISKEKLADPSAPLDIGTLTLACALDYVRFRIMHLDWQQKFPALAAWLEDMLNQASFAATAPTP